MDRVKPGQEFDVERLDRGDYRFVRRATRMNEGTVDWLLACPPRTSSYRSTQNPRTCCEHLVDANIPSEPVKPSPEGLPHHKRPV
jgi:hypothetical protein